MESKQFTTLTPERSRALELVLNDSIGDGNGLIWNPDTNQGVTSGSITAISPNERLNAVGKFGTHYAQ